MVYDSDQVAAFKQGLSKLLMSGSLTDMTIVCGAYKYNVHKVILCAHSDYFAALPNFAEGKTNTIHLKAIGEDDDDEACDDPEAIKLMVHYFYQLDYTATLASNTSSSDTSGTHSASKDAPTRMEKRDRPTYTMSALRTLPFSSRDSDMVMHAKVFAAAVKYQVAALSKLAAKKFKDAVRINCRHDSFAEAIRIVYSTTPGDVRTLRDVVTTTLDEFDHVLLEQDGVMQAVKDNKDVMFDLMCKARGLGAFKQSTSTSRIWGPPEECIECGGTLSLDNYGTFCIRCAINYDTY